jgi:hypothetical protein
MMLGRTSTRCASADPICADLTCAYPTLNFFLISFVHTQVMSTQVSGSALLRRVAARAGVGIWRQRGGLLVALAVVAAVSGYLAFGAAVQTPLGVNVGGSTSASADCADTAILAVADKSPGAAQRAYQCMDPSFQQRVSEQSFVQQVQSQALPNVNNVARVGDYRSQTGGSMVYYAVDSNGQSIGYIVYLNQNGKVLRIE